MVAEFVAGADDWGRSGPLASAGTTLMRAEWLARAGHKAQAQQERTRGAALWQQTLGVAWSGHFTGLH